VKIQLKFCITVTLLILSACESRPKDFKTISGINQFLRDIRLSQGERFTECPEGYSKTVGGTLPLWQMITCTSEDSILPQITSVSYLESGLSNHHTLTFEPSPIKCNEKSLKDFFLEEDVDIDAGQAKTKSSPIAVYNCYSAELAQFSPPCPTTLPSLVKRFSRTQDLSNNYIENYVSEMKGLAFLLKKTGLTPSSPSIQLVIEVVYKAMITDNIGHLKTYSHSTYSKKMLVLASDRERMISMSLRTVRNLFDSVKENQVLADLSARSKFDQAKGLIMILRN